MLRNSCLISAILFLGTAMTMSNATQQTTSLPPHPRLLFTKQDIPALRQRIASQAWAKARFDALKSQADGWLKTEVKLPTKGGQWYHYYSCPKHGARLRTEGPTRHVCPIDGEVLTGYPYDDVVISGDHNRLASGIRTLGIVYQLTSDARYAAKAKEILLAYAAKYESYPLHNIRGEARVGGGKVGPQTLDESTWLITVVEGADCIWDTLLEEEQKKVKDGLLYPATDVIRQHKMSIHNIQCWKNSAVGLTGLLIGDMKLVDEALKAESGYFNQMAKGVSPDGAWYEGAWGYHFYTVSAVVHLTEGAFHSGINLYGDEFKRMFDAPLTFAMPDMRLPAFNDSGIASVIGSAGFYEIAYARYKDDRYRAVLAQSKRDSDYALLYGAPDVTQTVSLRPASQNYPNSGYAILTAGKGNDATWFCLDYGPHGGGHGHSDKLGFVLFSLGQIIAPDPGTANYGVPIQGGWYRTTIAHNTLTIDEESQKPTEGKCEAFLAADGFSAVMAHAGNIYDGVSFRRTAALIGDSLLVFIDQIRADKEHTFDLAYHNVGKVTTPPDAQPVEPAKKAGYSYFRDAKSRTSSLGCQLTFDLDGGKQVRWAMAGGEPTTFIVGTGVGAHTEDRVPLVIARRQAIEAVYLWAVTLGAPAEMAQVTAEPVGLAGTPAPTSSVAAVRVTTPTGVHVLVANPQGEKVVIGGQQVDAKIAHLTPDGDGKLQVRHAAR
jgi:hypothetical protein